MGGFSFTREVRQMAQFRVSVKYQDGTVRILETSDGNRAMQEAASSSYEEDQPKSVLLEKDGDAIWNQKVKAYKPKQLG